ncbi:MAG TPA: hypothetical protein VGM27_21355 [Acidobacteriaceae bacterium]|jgi:hypothetical protein
MEGIHGLSSLDGKIEKPGERTCGTKDELLLRIYNDKEVQIQLRKTIEPLHHEGIKEFQTRRQGVVVATVSKADLQSADEAEIERLARDEEIDLGIEKAAWRRNLAWHFSDGRTSFDARIDDEGF